MNFLMSVLRPRTGSIAQLCTATVVLVILTGTSELLAQPRIIGVEPTSVELTAGGSPQTFRLTADGLTDVTGVRILQGRLTVTGFETTVRRTSITQTGIRGTLPARIQAGGSVTFEIELSAAASVAPASYAVQVLTGRIAVTVPLDLRVVAASRPAGRAVVGGARTILRNAPTAVRIDSVEEPAFRRYWVTNIRPGASGRLENQGIFDPDITDDPSDGVFWIEGANLDTPDLSIRMSGGYGSQEATILERSRSAGMDVIKARVSDFPRGRLMVSTSGGVTQSSYVPRLGYWAFPVAEVSALIQNVRCTIGSPRGRGTIVLPSRTLNFELGPMEGFGFRIETLDLNSNAITITSEPGGETGREVVLTTRIDFETSGREFDGSFLPTITWWECGTLRVQASECPGLDLACFAREIGSALAASLTCMDAGNWRERTGPGPAVPISGDLTSPRAVFRTTLGIESGELVAQAVDAIFDADVSLQTNVGTLPLGPLKSLILSGTNENLTEMIREANFGSEIATFVNNLSRGFGVERLRYIQRMSDGRIYMEYGQ